MNGRRSKREMQRGEDDREQIGEKNLDEEEEKKMKFRGQTKVNVGSWTYLKFNNVDEKGF